MTIDCSDCTEDETISIVVQGHDKGGANSGNDTNTVSLLVTPVLEYDLEVSASSTGQTGDSTVVQGDTLLWDFTIINKGWEDDEFEISLLDLSSFGGLFGILDDDETTDLVMLQIPGTGSNGQNYAILSVVFIPADDEIPGSHDFSLDVFGLDGGSESLENKNCDNSSKTILTNCWPGVTESNTFDPVALFFTLSINVLTTL